MSIDGGDTDKNGKLSGKMKISDKEKKLAAQK